MFDDDDDDDDGDDDGDNNNDADAGGDDDDHHHDDMIWVTAGKIELPMKGDQCLANPPHVGQAQDPLEPLSSTVLLV